MEIVIRKCGKPNWTSEAVKDRIAKGQAGLFISPDGFLILERCTEAVSEKPYLNVWLAWFKPTRAKAVRSEFVAWLDAKAKSIGCSFIEFSSPREGWAVIEPAFRKHMIHWRREL